MWLHDVFGDPSWRSLTWTLLHFLWQGLVVASVWKVLFRLVAARKVQVHYLLGLAGMFVMAGCPVATFVLLESESGRHGARLVAAPPSAEAVPDVTSDGSIGTTSLGVVSNSPEIGWNAPSWRAGLAERIGDVQPYLLSGWIMGLTLLSGRLLLGVVAAHRLGWGRQPVTEELARRTAALAGRMGFGRVPGVFVSGAACEAVVTRLLRPMVLLPVAWLAEMTPDVLEAVIAHELAHIRRHDLWANLFQRLVETLLFYHPAVWWLSRRVRVAREMCCDELAAGATGNCVAYATALELAARRRQAPARSFLEVALGVTHMTLLDRVRNVLGLVVRQDQGRWWPAAVLTLLVLPAIWLASTAAATSAEDKARPTAVLLVAPEKPLVGGDATKKNLDIFEIYKATQRQALSNRFVLNAALRKPEAAKLASIRHAQGSGNPITWLADRLRVTISGANMLEVSLSSDDPKEAAILVNAVVDAYLEVVNAELNQKRQRLGQLDEACVSLQRKMRDKREEIKKTADEVGASDTEMLSMKQKLALEELAALRQQMMSVEIELRTVSTNLAAQQALLEGLNKIDLNEADVETVVQSDPFARDLAVQIVLMSRKVKQSDQNRELDELQKQFDNQRARLAGLVQKRKQAELQKELKKLQTAKDIMAEYHQKLRNQVESKQAEAEKFGNSNVVIGMLRGELKNTDAMMAKISRERDELSLEVKALPRVTLLKRAEVPGAADK